MNADPSPATGRNNKKWLAVAAVLALVLIAALVWWLRSPAGETTAASAAAASEPKPVMTVTVAEPQRETLALALLANGNVSAWQEASVGAEVSGLRLAAVNVNVGDAVKKGQVLATFTTDTARADSLQSQASVVQAEAGYLNAKADADRARSIQDSGALSASQIAQYVTQEKVAKAQWEAAKALLSATEIRFGNTTVKAPDDGLISARGATVGAVVGAGQELFRLIRQGRMEWRAEVTASEVGRIRVGQKAQVTLATGTELTGQVRAIAPSANEQTRNILVYVDLPRHNDLKAGTFARGVFAIGQSEALTAPTPAIVVRDGNNFVFVVDADNKAAARQVQTGRRVGDRVEIVEGLQPGERVAVQGAGFLNDGDLVKVVQ
jgi:RND family efflux transporter MFP subunit